MNWSLVGWSHHQTPIDLRERLAFSPEQVELALQDFQSKFPTVECVLLSTCNRVELYTASNDQSDCTREQLIQFISQFHEMDAAELQKCIHLTGASAVEHLFKVASSLDSMIVGEAQIIAQVREAYELACQKQTAASQMHRIFQRAIAVARRITNETSIQRRRVSVPSVAISEIATEFFESFEDKNILLIGAGEMCTETLRYLKDAGAKKISIINRSIQRAQELARMHSLTAEPWEVLDLYIADADLIVSTTGAPHYIVQRDHFSRIRTDRNHAVLILDLAVPRDFDPSIAELPETYLYSVDDLQQVCDRNIQARQSEWPKAMKIVEQETQKFFAEQRHAGGVPTIQKLRQQADLIKQEELKRVLAKLQSVGLNPQIEKELSYAFDRLVNKILHPPLQSLRDNADSPQHASLLDALRRLFQIKD